MKKYLIAGLVCLVCLGLGWDKVKAIPSYFTTYKDTSSTVIAPSTGSYTYNLGGGDYNSDVDSNFLYVTLTAVATTTQLKWNYYYSLDNSIWFGEDTAAAPSSGEIVHYATDAYHSWTPASTSTVRRVLEVPLIAAPYKKVVFTTANATGTVLIYDTAKRDAAGY